MTFFQLLRCLLGFGILFQRQKLSASLTTGSYQYGPWLLAQEHSHSGQYGCLANQTLFKGKSLHMMKTLGSCQSSLSLPQTLKVPIASFFILDSGLELD